MLVAGVFGVFGLLYTLFLSTADLGIEYRGIDQHKKADHLASRTSDEINGTQNYIHCTVVVDLHSVLLRLDKNKFL